MNTCVLTGNLGDDPKMFYTSDGKPVASFNLAFRSGKDKTSWIKVTAFNKVAEICEQYLHKGAKIAISGMLDLDKWETPEGQTKSMIKAIANSIEFIKTDGNIETLYFPRYAPELNPQEHVWKSGRDKCSHNSFIENIDRATDGFVSFLNSNIFSYSLLDFSAVL